MRSINITLGLTTLALGSVLVASSALAQEPPKSGRNLNDGGAVTDPNGNYVGSSSTPSNQNGEASNCAARFHSFDPSTGTYLGFDGRRHACP